MCLKIVKLAFLFRVKRTQNCSTAHLNWGGGVGDGVVNERSVDLRCHPQMPKFLNLWRVTQRRALWGANRRDSRPVRRSCPAMVYLLHVVRLPRTWRIERDGFGRNYWDSPVVGKAIIPSRF